MRRPDRSDYILGSADEELARLGFQHRVWAEQTFALWKRAGFSRGQTILDLGCGPGFTAVDLAHLVGPQGRVLAVDSSRKFLAHLEAQARTQGLSNIQIRECDVHDLELEAASLDGAFARWLLCMLHDPERVVAMVAKALRPGGAFAVTDYFNYRAFTFAPRSSVFDRVVEALQKSWKLRGGDLEVQGKTPTMMKRWGLEVTDIRFVTSVARPGSLMWDWPRTFFRNFLPTLLEMKLITPEEHEAFEREWAERSKDPAAFLCPPPMFDVIGVKR